MTEYAPCFDYWKKMECVLSYLSWALYTTTDSYCIIASLSFSSPDEWKHQCWRFYIGQNVKPWCGWTICNTAVCLGLESCIDRNTRLWNSELFQVGTQLNASPLRYPRTEVYAAIWKSWMTGWEVAIRWQHSWLETKHWDWNSWTHWLPVVHPFGPLGECKNIQYCFFQACLKESLLRWAAVGVPWNCSCTCECLRLPGKLLCEIFLCDYK